RFSRDWSSDVCSSDLDPTLGVQMKAVGEVMAIGRTFKQAWQKGLRGLENGRAGWDSGARPKDDGLVDDDVGTLRAGLRRPTADQIGRAACRERVGSSV